MKKNILLSIGKAENKKALLPYVTKIDLGKYSLFATEKTSKFLTKNKVKNKLLYRISQPTSNPNLAQYLIRNIFDLIINIPTYASHKPRDIEYTDGKYIRRKAIENGTELITDLEVAILYLSSFAKDFLIKKSREKRKSPTASPFTAYYAPLYDVNKSYDFNYEFGPIFNGPFPPDSNSDKKEFLGFRLNSLFGVPAGPLLNSNWVKTYADLGFDIVTYKTVRTINKACHQPPNVVFIDPHKNYNYDFDKPAYSSKKGILPYNKISITNSFGVPSKEPDVWQEDVKKLLPQLGKGQLLILSVMGTLEEEMTEKEYVADFVRCALLGKETGVSVIEANLSCPNLGAGAIFNDISLSKKIVKNVKEAIDSILLLVKVGYFKDLRVLRKFVKETNEYVDGYVAINTVPKKIIQLNGEQALPGKARVISGTCGALIKKGGISVVGNLNKIRKAEKLKYKIIGVGGVMTPNDYFDYLRAGADAVQSATGAMWNPYLAYQVKKTVRKRI
jgi:dihydroorotate dehydrogenase (NAD+) catalytic subunit